MLGPRAELTAPVFVAHHLTYLSFLAVRELFVSENIHNESEGNSAITVSLAHLQRLGFADSLLHKLKTNASVSKKAAQPATSV